LGVLQSRLIFLNKPFIDLYKYYPDWIPIAQKTLKWSQRFVNALNTIHVRPGICHDCVLLIDDFVWSGATMNISAMKLKDVWVAKSVIWLAIVGNIDMTYDVINEI
jgi:hypoxanthine phosphoribosyltransferase